MNGFYYALDIIKNQLELDNDVNVVNTGIIEDVLLKKKDIYPYSHIIVNNASLNGSTWTFSYSVICMDIVDISKEQTTDIFRGQNNLQDVLNTQLVVINRLLEVLRRGESTNLYQMDGVPSCEPFEDRFEHGVAGWTVTFDLLVPNDMTVCDNDVTPVKLCPDFEYTITDSDSNVLYTGTKLSGESLTQIITDATVTNSLDTVLGTILAQGSLELADVNNIDSDGSTVPTPAGVPFTCTPAANATLTVNTDAFLTVASGSTTDISLVDQNDVDITPISLTSGTIKVNVPEAETTGLSAPLVVTGDTNDGQIGRDFWEFPIVSTVQQLNHFGNKWRITGSTGGYYDRDTSQFKDVNGNVSSYASEFGDGLFIDHFTKDWDGNLVMYYRGLTDRLGIPSLTQPYAKANPPASVGSFSSNWNLANINQLTRLQYQGKMQEQPFSPGHGTVFIMSSTDAIGAANIGATYYLQSDLWISGSAPVDKSTAAAANRYTMYTRITNTSEL